MVNTLAIDGIRPNAKSSTLMLDASSKLYKIPVSSFSMVLNCFMENTPFRYKKKAQARLKRLTLGLRYEQEFCFVEEGYFVGERYLRGELTRR